MPDGMKCARIKPLLKRASLDPNILKNFRPISNLSFISKILERVVELRIKSHLVEFSLYEHFQSAYRSAHSTETALIRLINDILVTIDDATKSVALLLLDLSAAFDTVNHDVLLQRLQSGFGLHGTVLSWFKSYLSNRSQKVKIGNSVSSHTSKLTTGVPQGSVLGPILFSMYMCPLGELIRRHNVNFHFYADDTQIYVSVSNSHSDSIKHRLEKCVSDIRNWMSSNFLLLNDSKTEFVLLSSNSFTSDSAPISSIEIGNEQVEVTFGARNLGVFLDSNLSMDKHISNISKSCFFYLRNISRIRNFLSRSDTEKLVHALVTSRLDSCNSVLAGLPACKLKPLSRVQNAAARLIVKARKYDHITDTLVNLHWLPIPQRIQFKLLLLVYKALHNLAPSYLNELADWYAPGRTLRSGVQYIAKEKSVKQSKSGGKMSKIFYKDRAFENLGPKLFNALPDYIRSSPSVEAFKSRLKTYLFQTAFNV